MMKMSKRILAVLLALLLPLLLAVPALALDSYELFARWEQDGYPEDVTGVFYNTETKCLAVVLTENTEARQKELRDTLTDGGNADLLCRGSTAMPSWRSARRPLPGYGRKRAGRDGEHRLGERTAATARRGRISGW